MERERELRVLVFACIVLGSLYVLVSLASYRSSEIDGFSYPPPDEIRNLGGMVGAYLAHGLKLALGVGAYLVPAIFIGCATMVLLDVGAWQFGYRLIGAVLFLASFSVLSGAIGAGFDASPYYGGMVGRLTYEKLSSYIGGVGVWISGILMILVSGYVLSLERVLLKIVQAGSALLRKKAEDKKPEKPKIEVRPSAESEPEPPKLTIKKPKEPVSREEVEEAELPPIELLDEPEKVDRAKQEQEVKKNAEILQRTLNEFGVDARLVEVEIGPVVARYGVELGAGVKVNRVMSLGDDLAIALKAPSVRVVAPIPGKSVVGIEVPNPMREVVRLRELITMPKAQDPKLRLPICLGKDTSGNPVITDLSLMPHLLIAGATNSGKSVCINAIICALLMRRTAEELRFIMIDPKMVELMVYEEIPHLLCPVITDARKAPWILDWAVQQMDERYDLLARAGVRSLAQYNSLGEGEIRRRLGEDVDYSTVPFKLPYIVVVVDELAELMVVAQREVEAYIVRLSQKARAVGIHLVTATQRPSVDVITGLIKANLTGRIAFRVTSKVDSRTILDRNGAEKLLGAGDLLYLPPDQNDLLRIQGSFVSDRERKALAKFVCKQGRTDYIIDLDEISFEREEGSADFDDELYQEACKIVLQTQRGSVSLLQRKLGIGYTRSARLIDMMAKEGIVGEYKGSKAREVLYTYEEWLRRKGGSQE